MAGAGFSFILLRGGALEEFEWEVDACKKEFS